jgi:hypothetical protein
MYGIFTYIYPKNDPNVGKYSIHGASGKLVLLKFLEFHLAISPYVCILGSQGPQNPLVWNSKTSLPNDCC